MPSSKAKPTCLHVEPEGSVHRQNFEEGVEILTAPPCPDSASFGI